MYHCIYYITIVSEDYIFLNTIFLLLTGITLSKIKKKKKYQKKYIKKKNPKKLTNESQLM
jgi:hypothetical protein